MSDTNAFEMSAEEQAYFDNRGEETEAPESEPAPEPEEGAEPAPEPEEGQDETPETDEDGEPVKPPKGFVPHKAFHAEREKRKELERQSAELAEKQARLEERLKVLAEIKDEAQKKQESAPEEQIPDINEDPIGHFQARIAQQQKVIDELNGKTQQSQQQQEQAAQFNQVVTEYKSQAMQFKQEKPDFDAAYNHLLSARAKEYAMLGVPEAEIPASISQDELGIVLRAKQLGKNPAEVIYALAMERGYKPGAGGEDVDNGGNGKERLEQIARGQNAAKSLSSAGGGKAPDISLENLANMSNDDFYDAVQRGVFRKALGG